MRRRRSVLPVLTVALMSSGCTEGADDERSTTSVLDTTTTTAAVTTELPPTTLPPATVPTVTRPTRPTGMATPAGGSCHSSYRGACIPANASDVDCPGGSGDGPAYAPSRGFQVVGPDVYDLDRDSDGIGCEG